MLILDTNDLQIYDNVQYRVMWNDLGYNFHSALHDTNYRHNLP